MRTRPTTPAIVRVRRGSRSVGRLLVGSLVGLTAAAGCSSSAPGVEQGRSESGGTTVEPQSETTGAPETTFGYTTEIVEQVVCPVADGSSPQIQSFPSAPPVCIDDTSTYVATMRTNIGPMTFTLDQAIAPLAVNSFVFLAGYHFFDNTRCHRIIQGFVIQCGDPTGTGTGGPGYTFADELPAAGAYHVGSLAMANAGPDTNGSQFFIITGDAGVALSPDYTLFGEVTGGLDTVAALDALGNPSGSPVSPVTVISVTVTGE